MKRQDALTLAALPLLGLWLLVARVISMLTPLLAPWLSYMLAQKLYYATPFAVYALRNGGGARAVFTRLGFEASYCMNGERRVVSELPHIPAEMHGECVSAASNTLRASSITLPLPHHTLPPPCSGPAVPHPAPASPPPSFLHRGVPQVRNYIHVHLPEAASVHRRPGRSSIPRNPGEVSRASPAPGSVGCRGGRGEWRSQGTRRGGAMQGTSVIAFAPLWCASHMPCFATPAAQGVPLLRRSPGPLQHDQHLGLPLLLPHRRGLHPGAHPPWQLALLRRLPRTRLPPPRPCSHEGHDAQCQTGLHDEGPTGGRHLGRAHGVRAWAGRSRSSAWAGPRGGKCVIAARQASAWACSPVSFALQRITWLAGGGGGHAWPLVSPCALLPIWRRAA